MSELTSSVLDTVRKCSPAEKDLILSELVREKWDREGRQPTLFIPTEGRPSSGFCLVVDPAIPSTMPPFTEADWTELREDVKHLDDALTTVEAKEFLRQAVARRYDKEQCRGG